MITSILVFPFIRNKYNPLPLN